MLSPETELHKFVISLACPRTIKIRAVLGREPSDASTHRNSPSRCIKESEAIMVMDCNYYKDQDTIRKT
jgi:hypothetical protein